MLTEHRHLKSGFAAFQLPDSLQSGLLALCKELIYRLFWAQSAQINDRIILTQHLRLRNESVLTEKVEQGFCHRFGFFVLHPVAGSFVHDQLALIAELDAGFGHFRA